MLLLKTITMKRSRGKIAGVWTITGTSNSDGLEPGADAAFFIFEYTASEQVLKSRFLMEREVSL